MKGTSIVSIRAYVHSWATLPISVILHQVSALTPCLLGCSNAGWDDVGLRYSQQL